MALLLLARSVGFTIVLLNLVVRLGNGFHIAAIVVLPASFLEGENPKMVTGIKLRFCFNARAFRCNATRIIGPTLRRRFFGRMPFLRTWAFW